MTTTPYVHQLLVAMSCIHSRAETMAEAAEWLLEVEGVWTLNRAANTEIVRSRAEARKRLLAAATCYRSDSRDCYYGDYWVDGREYSCSRRADGRCDVEHCPLITAGAGHEDPRVASVQGAWRRVSAIVSYRVDKLRPEDVADARDVAAVVLRLVRQALTTCGYRRAP